MEKRPWEVTGRGKVAERRPGGNSMVQGREMTRLRGVDGSFFVPLLPCQFDLLSRIASNLTKFSAEGLYSTVKPEVQTNCPKTIKSFNIKELC